MTIVARELLKAALDLPAEERAELAEELLASLPVHDDAEVGWDEVVRRAREVHEGRATLVDGPSSLRAVRDRFASR